MRRFRIEFWEDERGAKPVLEWIKDDLSGEQRAALGKAMQHTLQVLGVGVCATQFGKQLGDGLCEFRLRYNLPELLHRFAGRGTRRSRRSAGSSARSTARSPRRHAPRRRSVGAAGPTGGRDAAVVRA